jgi:hypothetical protein
MPIEYRIDHKRRLVIARGIGALVHEDFMGYQQSVWSDPAIASYNELVDMTGVENIELESSSRIKELAMTSAGMDAPGAERRFAIVAKDDLAFGLGRMYEAYREMQPQSRKRVGVFRTMREALEYLDIKEPIEPWEAAPSPEA